MKARENPFASVHIESIRYRFSNDSWNDIMRRLDNLRYRAAIVGPEGSGKTTLLEELERKLNATGFVTRKMRIPKGGRLPPDFWRHTFSGELLLVDSADQLGWLEWMLLLRRASNAAGLIITAHKPGRLATLIECTTSPELLGEICSELTGRTYYRQELHTLFDRHGGNIRVALRELYDQYALSS